MKVFNLIVFVFVLAYCFDFYRWHIDEFKDWFKDKTPSRYSDDQDDVRTVTFMPSPRKTETNDSSSLIPNSKFKYEPNPFAIDDTELLRGLGLTCMPDSFGYTVDKGIKIFPDFQYPKCSDKNRQNDTFIHIDRNSNTLYMNCPEGKNKEFIVGPVDKRKIVRSNEVYYKWKISKYKSPTDASDIEFAIGRCENNDYFTQGAMSPRFNKSAYTQAISKVTKKPRIIYFLTLDSYLAVISFVKCPE